MFRPAVIACLMLIVGAADAQFSSVPASARSSALGGMHELDSTMRRISMGYRQGYGMAGMATRTLDARWRLGSSGWLEVGYSHFGDHAYHEQQALVGYGMSLSPSLMAGIRGRYLHLGTGDAYYESQRWLAAEVYVQAMAGERLRLYAACASRPWDESKPWRTYIGMAYMAVEGLTTLVELDSDDRTRMRLGAEYGYRQHYFIRTGLATHPMVLSFGLGAHLGTLRIDLAVETHEYLGLTPHISLSLCP